MLKYRLITALVLIPIVITVLFLLPLIGFVLVVLFLCMLSAWEWGQLAGFNSHSQRIWFAIFCGLILLLMIITVPIYQSFLNIWQTQYFILVAIVWWSAALLLVLCYPYSAVLWRKSKLLILVFGILTILPCFWGILVLRQHNYNINHFTGAWWLLYLLVLVWSADSGAYIFGRAFGRHKLAPKVSPSKTWEGLIGGLIISATVAWVFNKYAPLEVTPITLFICSIMTALASILGDLAESMFKREVGIKDSSHLIPGHGGILDRIDSLTAAVPVFTYLMLLVFNIT